MKQNPGVYLVRAGGCLMAAACDGHHFTCEMGPIDDVYYRIDTTDGFARLIAEKQAEALDVVLGRTDLAEEPETIRACLRNQIRAHRKIAEENQHD